MESAGIGNRFAVVPPVFGAIGIDVAADVAAANTDALRTEAGANVEPDEVAESVFLSEQREQELVVVSKPVVANAREETEGKDLPPLDELVQRIPAEARSAMDELFRAKFIAVRRIPKSALKA